MTKIDKLFDKFKENPESLKYSQIIRILKKVWFNEVEASGSHKKIYHPTNGKHVTVALHDNDCKDWLKKLILQFYISNPIEDENSNDEL